MKVRLAPSILSADFARLGEEVNAVAVAGADLVHVDVMDGRFVPPITIGSAVVRDLHKVSPLPLDVHLMVSEPDHLLEEFAAAGSAYLTVHCEASVHLDRTLRQIRKLGMKAGVALNPATPPGAVEWVLELVDLVLVMSVNPGYGGQQFIAGALRKVEWLAMSLARQGLAAEVEVDGGVVPANAGSLSAAGATILVAGSAVFGKPDYAAAIAALREACR